MSPNQPNPSAGTSAVEPADLRIEIDRRPLPVVLVSRLRPQLWIAICFGLFINLLGLTPPQGLDETTWSTLCVFALCATLWATSSLPMAITSLLAIALIPLLNILPAAETYAYFGSNVVFFILGAFMLGAALIATGLSKRLATLFVRRFGSTPKKLITAIFILCAMASTVMSSHAVAVMVLPLVRDVERALALKRGQSVMGKALYFALMWGCVMGGSLTVLGGGRGPLAIGLLEEATAEQYTITFTAYITYTWPLVALLLAVGYILLRYGFKPEIRSTDRALEQLESNLRDLGKMTPRQLAVGIVVSLTIVLWTLAGDTYGLANIAICSMAALFAVGALRWEDIQGHVNWGIIVMYGGAICLGGVMERTGAAIWLTEQLLPAGPLSGPMLMLGLAAVGAVLTEFTSNSAVVAMLMPPALSMAQAHGIDPVAMTMAVVLPSNFAFMFPISTPVTAMAWSGGFFRAREVTRTGLILHAVAWSGMALLILGFWPMIGVN